MAYLSTKTYGHDLGISCAFRQWRALSHCRFLHGYALSFKLTFQADVLDHRNWVMDFGGLAIVKAKLMQKYDHQTLVAKDDPMLSTFMELRDVHLAQVQLVDATGCEAFARDVFSMVGAFLAESGAAPRVKLVSVECREHGANSAVYTGEEE